MSKRTLTQADHAIIQDVLTRIFGNRNSILLLVVDRENSPEGEADLFSGGFGNAPSLNDYAALHKIFKLAMDETLKTNPLLLMELLTMVQEGDENELPN